MRAGRRSAAAPGSLPGRWDLLARRAGGGDPTAGPQGRRAPTGREERPGRAVEQIRKGQPGSAMGASFSRLSSSTRWAVVCGPQVGCAPRLCVHTASGWALPAPWRPAPPFWAWLQHSGDLSRTPTLRGPHSRSSPREWAVATATDTEHPGETLVPEPPEEAGLGTGYPRKDTVSLVCPPCPHLSAQCG